MDAVRFIEQRELGASKPTEPITFMLDGSLVCGGRVWTAPDHRASRAISRRAARPKRLAVSRECLAAYVIHPEYSHDPHEVILLELSSGNLAGELLDGAGRVIHLEYPFTAYRDASIAFSPDGSRLASMASSPARRWRSPRPSTDRGSRREPSSVSASGTPRACGLRRGLADAASSSMMYVGPNMSSSNWVGSTSGDWDTASNWAPAEMPNTTATFGASSQTQLTFSVDGASVTEILFVPGAPSYTFTFTSPSPSTPTLTITGSVANTSGMTQRFVVASSSIAYQNAQLVFASGAVAGNGDVAYTVGPATPASPGGGVLGFLGTASAGGACFTVTTGAGTPVEPSTVGGEVSFSNSSTAATASFVIYGSTSTTDGDTFGNVVFHDTATAAGARFTNIGGTVAGGDGGNTQFYDLSNAGQAVFENQGGVAGPTAAQTYGANGGDVAFDGTATAATATFHNYPATVDGAYGGVTSFNNNKPVMAVNEGATAGFATFHNYGGVASLKAGGGHTEFSGMYGAGNGASGCFFNYGARIANASSSSAGHTIFSVSSKQKAAYQPTAGGALYVNLPGAVANAPGGYTQFTVYTSDDASAPASASASAAAAAASAALVGPTAGTGRFLNLPGFVEGASGGYTTFSGNATAGSATLIASGGLFAGGQGEIRFSAQSLGGTATVQLVDGGVLDIGYHDAPGVSIGALDVIKAGTVKVALGTVTTGLTLSGDLTLTGTMSFSFHAGSGFTPGTSYTVLVAPNLSAFTTDRFTGNAVGGASPVFTIEGAALSVSFSG